MSKLPQNDEEINNNHLRLEPNKLNQDMKKNVISRLLVAAVLIGLGLPTIIFGDYVFVAVALFCVCVSTFELIKVPQSIEKKYNYSIIVFAYFMSISICYGSLISRIIDHFALNKLSGFYNIFYSDFNTPEMSLSLFAIGLAFLFLTLFLDKNFKIDDVFYFIVMIFVVALGFQCLMYLRFYPYTEVINAGSTVINNTVILSNEANETITSPIFKYCFSAMLVIYCLLGSLICDAGAYFVGILFGKHKLCPRISPKKTVEGFIGGIVISFVVTFTLAMVLAAIGHPILKIFDLEHWYFILIVSLLMPLVSTMGDLIFSSVKRHYNIKDYGNIFKSHGGMLDRFDSILCTAIFLGCIIPFFNYLISLS